MSEILRVCLESHIKRSHPANVTRTVIKRIHIATMSLIAALGLTAVAGAAVYEADDAGGTLASAVPATAAQADRWQEAGRLYSRYRELLTGARKLDVAPRNHVLAETVVDLGELREGVEDLRARIADAREFAGDTATEGTVEGVSLDTLNAIAACESGGDPGAVNAAGYYGKYQFDMGTWASVGGSGNPAEASEAEQDHRAALLYSRAGSSPWPVCGQ